jgi:hypothetical protein
MFIADLLKGTFLSINGVVTWIGIAAFLLSFFPIREGNVKTFIEKHRKTYAFYAFPWFILISVIITSYSMNEDKQQQITNLQKTQNKISNTDTQKTITKQDMRTFLESINPTILQAIDNGEKEINVCLGTIKEAKFIELSGHPDFDKFLSFKQIQGTTVGKNRPGFITESGQQGIMNNYCLYPKDALVK